MGAARLGVQVDIGIGDVVTPAPEWLEYPSLLDLPRPRLRAYPRETVIAEKLHAMEYLGLRNSRMKDYFDVYVLLREGKTDTSAAGRSDCRHVCAPPNRVARGYAAGAEG